MDPSDESTGGWVLWSPVGLLTAYDHLGSWWYIGFLAANREPSKALRAEAEKLLAEILAACSSHKIPQNRLRASKVGGILANPYAIYREMSRILYTQAKSVAAADIVRSSDSGPVETLAASSLFASAYIASLLSAEGFVNLTHTILVHDRFRIDLYEQRWARELLPVKILELDLRCRSFAKAPFAASDELFKALQHIINARNSLLHANISSAMVREAVRTEGGALMLTTPQVERKYGLASDINVCTNVDVIRAGRLIQKMITRIISSLEPSVMGPYIIQHGYLFLGYGWTEKGEVTFQMDDYDYAELAEGSTVRRFLAQSTELDDDYYRVDEPEYTSTVGFP
jgi:hypothetical protein